MLNLTLSRLNTHSFAVVQQAEEAVIFKVKMNLMNVKAGLVLDQTQSPLLIFIC